MNNPNISGKCVRYKYIKLLCEYLSVNWYNCEDRNNNDEKKISNVKNNI